MDNNVEKVVLGCVDWKSSREFFESLGEALDKLDDKDESYNFTWVGKRKSIVEAGTPINKTLRPDIEASKDFDNTKNMLIVGDNLDALKLLQESYLGKIKMIYIDPPYNTGHDFVYHDNFTIKKTEFEDSTKDSDGNVIVSEDAYLENSKANGRYHSDWLSMMYPRLKLARNLLADDGVIFISIDDNEASNLRQISDEILGEDNYICTFVWEKHKAPKNDNKYVTANHEYILLYARDKDSFNIKKDPRSEENINSFKNEDNDPRGPWSSGPLLAPTFSASTVFPIINPHGQEIYPPAGKCWSFNKAGIDRLLSDNRIWFGSDGHNTPRIKRFLSELPDGIVPRSLLSHDTYGGNQKAANDLKKLFDDKKIFDFSKPIDLIKYFIDKSNDSNGLVLDFFAGSGTVGHAMMDLNAEDGGNRRYILVQLSEKTDDKSEAKKAGYNTIDQITAERLRRAGNKIKKDYPDADIDTGFRVFRVDSENENSEVRKQLGEINQSDLFNVVDNIKKDRTPLDLLFGVVYASALPFDLKLETRKIGDNTIYLYGYLDEGTGLIACFDDNISEDTIKEIAGMKSLTAAFKDSSFVDSAAKINLSEQFRVISPDTKVKVI